MKQTLQNLTRKTAYGLLLGGLIVSYGCSVEEPSNELPVNDLAINNGQVISGKFIVRFKDGTASSSGMRLSPIYAERQAQIKEVYTDILSDYSIKSENMEKVYSSSIEGFAGLLSADQLSRLKSDPRVLSIEEDRIVALAPPPGKGPGGGGGGTAGQEVPYGITRVGGPVNYTGSNVAWIIDSGIDLDHPDLNVNASRGFNAFTSGKDGGSLDDGNGHGSHVAGTIAAINNTIGVVGVAAGATVIPVKVLGSRGSGSYSGVIAGVDFVGANGSNGDVANMSLGGPISTALDAAVASAASKGIKFVLAAGNEATNASNSSPARVNGNNIYTISAMDSNDRFASFSNYGNPPVDYCAPGVSIKSTWKGGGYNTISGTSMASPHAAGILLLGAAGTDGRVSNDPDGNADYIIVR